MSTTNPAIDGKRARSLATQQALMDAGEKLIANKGLKQVSIKEIVAAAGQKNESALQYHFGGLQGLIRAIAKRRETQVQAKRSDMLATLLSETAEPSLRELCRLMVMPGFLLARSDPGFRRYIAGFSQELALTQDSAFALVQRKGGGGESGTRTGERLRTNLSHLDAQTWHQRMEFAVRLCSVAMGNHARQNQAFRGQAAEHFASNLVDVVEGILKAPVSAETAALAPAPSE